MKIKRQVLLCVAIVLASIASLSCDRLPEKLPKTQPDVLPGSAPANQRGVAQDPGKIKFEGNHHDLDKERSLVGTINFVVRNPQWAKDGPSPYVSIESPARDIQFMDAADDIAVPGGELYLVVDYPVTGTWEFRITAANSKGFTRAELADKISQVYRSMYAEEERTSSIEVVPLEQRKKLINRNKTGGKYGIWGHDIGDLVLHTVEIYQARDGKRYAVLGIDS
ncbi:MAG: hypothetical protein HYS18_15720 [Burkholderiales bacterium]|nr:hypothetical protein [Burkholderiales bacterium]